jgi:hypothetical protein
VPRRRHGAARVVRDARQLALGHLGLGEHDRPLRDVRRRVQPVEVVDEHAVAAAAAAAAAAGFVGLVGRGAAEEDVAREGDAQPAW